MNCSEASPEDLPKSTQSHHLSVLRDAGLVHTREEGTRCSVVIRRDDVDARFPDLLDAVPQPGIKEPLLEERPGFLMIKRVGMHAGEPHLQDILRLGIVGLAEAVVHEGLLCIPLLEPEHAAALVDRDRLAEGLHARILDREGELFQARPVEPVAR